MLVPTEGFVTLHPVALQTSVPLSRFEPEDLSHPEDEQRSRGEHKPPTVTTDESQETTPQQTRRDRTPEMRMVGRLRDWRVPVSRPRIQRQGSDRHSVVSEQRQPNPLTPVGKESDRPMKRPPLVHNDYTRPPLIEDEPKADPRDFVGFALGAAFILLLGFVVWASLYGGVG